MSWLRKNRRWWSCWCKRVIPYDAKNEITVFAKGSGYSETIYLCDTCLAVTQSAQGPAFIDEVVRKTGLKP